MSRFVFSNYSPELSHSVTSLRLVQLGSDFTSFMKDLTSQALRGFSFNWDCGPCLPKMNKCQEEFSFSALLFSIITPSYFLFLIYSSLQGVGGLPRSPPSAHDLVSLLQEHLCYTLIHSTTTTRVCSLFFFFLIDIRVWLSYNVVSFCCTAKWIHYTHIHCFFFFKILFPFRSLQSTDYRVPCAIK